MYSSATALANSLTLMSFLTNNTNNQSIMKKIWIYMISLAIFAGLFSACKKDSKDNEPDVKPVATVSQQDLTGAFASLYSEWEKTTTIPSSLDVAGKSLTQPQYQQALCALVVNLTSGKTSGDIDVLNYKPADHPERDSYDAETIAVTGEESVATVATKMLQAMKEKGQVPNQTLFTRNGQAIAFSTNRATVTLARTVAAYKSDGKLPSSVSTEYLSASATLRGFAEQLVSYLDVWQKTVGTVSADGSHCSDNNSAWENVHFIPIPYSGGYSDGKDQYDPKYQPYHTVTVAGTEYTAAQCFVIAAKGFLDLVTKEGSAMKQTERNTPVHNLGNGKGLSEKIPLADEWATWGSYPWYEKSDEPCGVINFSDNVPCDLGFMVRTLPWFLKRAQDLGCIGNFLNYDEDPDGSLVMPPYRGIISPMRTFLIMCRFYKHLLDGGRVDRIEAKKKPKGLAPKTVRNIHQMIGSAYNLAIEQKLVTRNPTQGCALPKVEHKEMKTLTADQLSAFFQEARDSGVYELYYLDLATGLRRGELLGLKWTDVDLDRGVLKIQRAISRQNGKVVEAPLKTKNAYRTLPLSADAISVLKMQKCKVGNSEWVFPSPTGGPMSPDSVLHMLQRVLKRAGLPRIRFHDLRHPYVKHTTKIFSLRLMDFQAQAYPDARRKTRGACQLHRGGQSQSPVRPLCNRKRFSCLPPQSKMSWILYAISMRLSGYTSTRSISSSASSVVSVSASKIALDASLRLSCRACSSCFCFACANTAA